MRNLGVYVGIGEDQSRNADHVTCDQTGWRIGGIGHWLHAAVTRDACAYLIDKARGSDATDQLIGEDFAGTLIHDGWKAYDRYCRATHQQCNTHLIRRCGEMIEAATPGAAVFPSDIRSILKHAWCSVTSATPANERCDRPRSTRQS